MGNGKEKSRLNKIIKKQKTGYLPTLYCLPAGAMVMSKPWVPPRDMSGPRALQQLRSVMMPRPLLPQKVERIKQVSRH